MLGTGANPVALASLGSTHSMYHTACLRKGSGGACKDLLEGLKKDAP